MKYMLLVYGEERLWSERPGAKVVHLDDSHARWAQELKRSGHSHGMAGLHSAATATTVRAGGGRVVLTDGPFAETREVLGGYQVVECSDLDEAIAIASRFPALRDGFSMEIRPVMLL